MARASSAPSHTTRLHRHTYPTTEPTPTHLPFSPSPRLNGVQTHAVVDVHVGDDDNNDDVAAHAVVDDDHGGVKCQ